MSWEKGRVNEREREGSFPIKPCEDTASPGKIRPDLRLARISIPVFSVGSFGRRIHKGAYCRFLEMSLPSHCK